MFASLKMWAGALVGVAFGGLILWAKMLKRQRDAARRAKKLLEAGRSTSRKIKKISKEEEKKLTSRTAKLIRDIEEKKNEFKGVDNLNNPNDY